MKCLLKNVFVVFFSIVFLSNCVSKKKIIYFQNDEIDQAKVSNSYKTIIKPDDLLQISITAINTAAVAPFNITAGVGSLGVGSSQLDYLVDTNGEIDFPVLGKLKVGGLSRDELIQFLKNKLAPDYVLNPNINIRISNYKVTVLGDVKGPGSYPVPNERITILEAIALAGDLNLTAIRNNILVQREENGQKIQYRVDLLSKNIFTSPVYYLQQNDVVYVEPNYASIQSASANSNVTFYLSIVSLFALLINQLSR
ncbi:polysaccharide biosynthesis/export family protein [Polaribacter litorisediminis]|uniref:polysaccharide biosynthesis/export family protein n=1 Tax=Polaribacter litorisediminis TaxID=1908341 RepID=UPI001CC0DAAB|nr:polysaccharide biosynthesis/export family protein [Polaribacter litorisediminis]UAM96580.1 polysaccharide biosynthesis/export family protein [Polaribacter litorisediminis]